MNLTRIVIFTLIIIACLFLTAGGCSPSEPDTSTNRPAKIYLVSDLGEPCVFDYTESGLDITLEILDVDGNRIGTEKFTTSDIKTSGSARYLEPSTIPKSGYFGMSLTIVAGCNTCCDPKARPLYSGSATDADIQNNNYFIRLRKLTCIVGGCGVV